MYTFNILAQLRITFKTPGFLHLPGLITAVVCWSCPVLPQVLNASLISSSIPQTHHIDYQAVPAQDSGIVRQLGLHLLPLVQSATAFGRKAGKEQHAKSDDRNGL